MVLPRSEQDLDLNGWLAADKTVQSNEDPKREPGHVEADITEEGPEANEEDQVSGGAAGDEYVQMEACLIRASQVIWLVTIFLPKGVG